MFANFVADKIIRNLGDLVGGDSKDRMIKRYAEMSKNNKKKYVQGWWNWWNERLRKIDHPYHLF